jgi:hypothetical protein
MRYLIEVNIGTICRRTNVYPVFRFLPHTRKHLWCDRSNSCADSVLQLLQISLFFQNTPCSWCIHRRKRPEQLNPGFWCGQGVSPLLPIRFFGNFTSKAALTRSPQWGAPGVWGEKNWTPKYIVATSTVLYRTSHIIDVQNPTILLWTPCIT